MNISPAQVEQSLATLENRLSSILDPGANRVLAQAKSMLRQSSADNLERRRQHRQARPLRPWGFHIAPDDPLTFKETEIDKLKIKVDLFLRAFWETQPAGRPCELTVTLRIWCLSPAIYFRDQWDAPALQDRINPATGRVMLRVHFDLANAGQPGPRHHVQVGGVPHSGELHWFPEKLSVPRMVHMPVDLVLATEMVAATFYPENYEHISREPSWVSSRRISEKHLLSDYLALATNAIGHGSSVLKALWND